MGNPNHDKDGKFSSSPSTGSKIKGHLKTAVGYGIAGAAIGGVVAAKMLKTNMIVHAMNVVSHINRQHATDSGQALSKKK